MSREITTHHVKGAPNPVRLWANDKPDHEKGGGANHEYFIDWGDGPDGTNIHFQHGPIREHEVNGLTNEVLLAVVLDRLEAFQKGPFACGDNDMALIQLYAALDNLRKRTIDRIARGVEGENKT